MRFRGLLVAVVLLAALGAGLYFTNKQKAAEAAKPPADAPPKIVALTEGDITKVALKKKGADETVLEKANGKWQLTEPKPYPADQDTASQLVSSATNISGDRVVEDKASNLSAYGLNAPNLEVDITGKGGKVSKFKLGDDTPTNSGAYAMLDGDPRVFTVASYVKSGLDKSVNDLRDNLGGRCPPLATGEQGAWSGDAGRHPQAVVAQGLSLLYHVDHVADAGRDLPFRRVEPRVHVQDRGHDAELECHGPHGSAGDRIGAAHVRLPAGITVQRYLYDDEILFLEINLVNGNGRATR